MCSFSLRTVPCGESSTPRAWRWLPSGANSGRWSGCHGWSLPGRSGGSPEERECASSAGKVSEPREWAGWGGLNSRGLCGNNVLQARKMGRSLGAGHFPQPKERRAGEQKAAAADPGESPALPGFWITVQGPEPLCRWTCGPIPPTGPAHSPLSGGAGV